MILLWQAMKLPLKVIAIFGAILLGFAAQSKADAPRIEKGVLDLREWDFARDGWITLRGEMPFFWNNWIDPREPIPLDKSDAFASLSQSWTKIQKDGVPLPAYGYASYGLTILLPESEQDLAIEIGGLMSASRVFVAGEQVYQAGTPSRDPSEALSAFYSDVTAVGGRSGKLQVVFHISNWDFFRPGDYAPLYIRRHRRHRGDVHHRPLPLHALSSAPQGPHPPLFRHFLFLSDFLRQFDPADRAFSLS